jgi:hypothetical protein
MFHPLQPHEAFLTPVFLPSSFTAYNFHMSVIESFQALTAVVDQLVESSGFQPHAVDEFSEVSKESTVPIFRVAFWFT